MTSNCLGLSSCASHSRDAKHRLCIQSNIIQVLMRDIKYDISTYLISISSYYFTVQISIVSPNMYLQLKWARARFDIAIYFERRKQQLVMPWHEIALRAFARTGTEPLNLKYVLMELLIISCHYYCIFQKWV